MAAQPNYVFSSELFNAYVTKSREGPKELNDIFQSVGSSWRGRAEWEFTDTKDGVKFKVGPDQSSLATLTVTVDPETGRLKFKKGPVDHITNFLVQGRPSPWDKIAIQKKIFDLMESFVDDTRTARGRDLRGMVEASKSFEFGTKGRSLPDAVQSNIASFLTGMKSSAGPPQEQMRKLRDEADPDYAEKLEEKRSQETLAALKGGRRKKTRRSLRKKRTTRRR
jgi:hypothetical protein